MFYTNVAYFAPHWYHFHFQFLCHICFQAVQFCCESSSQMEQPSAFSSCIKHVKSLQNICACVTTSCNVGWHVSCQLWPAVNFSTWIISWSSVSKTDIQLVGRTETLTWCSHQILAHSSAPNSCQGQIFALLWHHCMTQWQNSLFENFIHHLTPYHNVVIHKAGGDMWWHSQFRHCATNWKVAGSIPDGVTGIFHWHYPSGRTMALGMTLPLTEMSTRNISWGGKGGRCIGLTTLLPSCVDCLEIWEPQPPGTLRACPGL